MPKKPIRQSFKTKKSFGPVSTVNTAPVAIGNSIRGAKASVTSSVDGARVVGRDFAFNLSATASTVNGWELVGGMPLTPCVLPSSVLRNYAQMFQYFKINKATLHYITSSATSQTGDVMFYYERDRKQPMVDYTNSSFLPFVLSDSNTVIGPQWTNHTIFIDPVKEWRTTAYALNSDLNEDAMGTVLMFSKTSTSSSPGYILIDYDISFKGMSVNPRAGQLPIARGQVSQIAIGESGTAVTSGVSNLTSLDIRGYTLAGGASAAPNNNSAGDIYKATFCVTSSQILNTWTNVTAANLLTSSTSFDAAITVDDGFTAYLACYDVTQGGGEVIEWALYPTLENAILLSGAFKYGVSATVTFALICNIQLVFSRANSLLQASY